MRYITVQVDPAVGGGVAPYWLVIDTAQAEVIARCPSELAATAVSTRLEAASGRLRTRATTLGTLTFAGPG